MFIFDHSLQITQPNLTPMLSFRVFASIESRPTHSHLVGKIPTRSGHPRRFVSPPPRDLCGRRLPRPCRDVGVHPGKTIRVGLVDRRTPAHSLIGRSLRTRPVPILSGRSRPCRDWLGVSPIPRRSSHPTILSLAGACDPAWIFLPTLPFQPSIEHPGAVGTVDCQLPPYISPCSQVLYLQHLWDPLVCVVNKRLTATLNLLDATLTKKPGVGGERLMTPLHPGLGGNDYGAAQRLSRSAKIRLHGGGDTVSTEAVAARRHAGTHLPATWWKLELPTTTWHLLLN